MLGVGWVQYQLTCYCQKQKSSFLLVSFPLLSIFKVLEKMHFIIIRSKVLCHLTTWQTYPTFCGLVIVRYRESKVSTKRPLSSRSSQSSQEINGEIEATMVLSKMYYIISNVVKIFDIIVIFGQDSITNLQFYPQRIARGATFLSRPRLYMI